MVAKPRRVQKKNKMKWKRSTSSLCKVRKAAGLGEGGGRGTDADPRTPGAHLAPDPEG